MLQTYYRMTLSILHVKVLFYYNGSLREMNVLDLYKRQQSEHIRKGVGNADDPLSRLSKLTYLVVVVSSN